MPTVIYGIAFDVMIPSENGVQTLMFGTIVLHCNMSETARATDQQGTQDSALSYAGLVLAFKSVLRPEGSNSSEKRAAV